MPEQHQTLWLVSWENFAILEKKLSQKCRLQTCVFSAIFDGTLRCLQMKSPSAAVLQLWLSHEVSQNMILYYLNYKHNMTGLPSLQEKQNVQLNVW